MNNLPSVLGIDLALNDDRFSDKFQDLIIHILPGNTFKDVILIPLVGTDPQHGGNSSADTADSTAFMDFPFARFHDTEPTLGVKDFACQLYGFNCAVSFGGGRGPEVRQYLVGTTIFY